MIKLRMNCAHGVSLSLSLLGALLFASLFAIATPHTAQAATMAVPVVGDRFLQSTDNPDAGTGPENALTPTGEQVTLDGGEWRWYIFEYGYEGDSDPSEAIAELQMTEPGSIDFEVWTQDDIRRWRNGEDFSPTGAGTPAFAIEDDESDNRDRTLLRWVGSGEATVRYYLVVQNQTDSQVSYSLNVTGPTVSFIGPGDSTLDESTATEAMTGTMTMTDTGGMTDTMSDSSSGSAAMMATGTGPDDAMIPRGGSRTLAAGERRWYTFRYNSDGDFDTEPEEAIAELQMSRPGAIDFEVWSQDDLQRWRNGEDFTPTGAGTPAFVIESDDDGDNRDRSLLRWVGAGEATVDYYLIVENSSDSAASYRLRVTGPTVSFPAASASTMAESTDMADSAAMTDTTDMTDTTSMTDTMPMTDTDAGAVMGTGPDNALTITPGTRTLAPGEVRWYTFEYTSDGDASTEANEAVVELRMAQAGQLDFEVWTEDQVELWRNGVDFTPVGRGTAAFALTDDESTNRDRSLLRWVGSGEETVRYYVLVENNSDTTAQYRLRVSGVSVNP